MKFLLALFVVAMAGYCKGWSWIPGIPISKQIADTVNRYQPLATGNAEFSQRLEQLFYINREPDSTHERSKQLDLDSFNAYNGVREMLEAKMIDRIDQINSKLSARRLKKSCRTKYEAQKSILSNSLKFSNTEKSQILADNNINCIYMDLPDDNY